MVDTAGILQQLLKRNSPAQDCVGRACVSARSAWKTGVTASTTSSCRHVQLYTATGREEHHSETHAQIYWETHTSFRRNDGSSDLPPSDTAWLCGQREKIDEECENKLKYSNFFFSNTTQTFKLNNMCKAEHQTDQKILQDVKRVLSENTTWTSQVVLTGSGWDTHSAFQSWEEKQKTCKSSVSTSITLYHKGLQFCKKWICPLIRWPHAQWSKIARNNSENEWFQSDQNRTPWNLHKLLFAIQISTTTLNGVQKWFIFQQSLAWLSYNDLLLPDSN